MKAITILVKSRFGNCCGQNNGSEILMNFLESNEKIDHMNQPILPVSVIKKK